MVYNEQILLNSIDKVKAFIAIVSKFDVDLDIIHGRYVIDGKSIMGIFSLNLATPLELRILTKESFNYNKFIEEIDSFLIKE